MQKEYHLMILRSRYAVVQLLIHISLLGYVYKLFGTKLVRLQFFNLHIHEFANQSDVKEHFLNAAVERK